jgi:hypothetical protein
MLFLNASKYFGFSLPHLKTTQAIALFLKNDILTFLTMAIMCGTIGQRKVSAIDAVKNVSLLVPSIDQCAVARPAASINLSLKWNERMNA